MTFLVMSLTLLSCAPQPTKTAQWITHPKFKHSPNQWFKIRKAVKLKEKPTELKTAIAADSKYWLYINGELAIFEGQLKRGPNKDDTYYDEIDLAPYLQKGENTIAALVWYFGREGFSHKDSKQFGFLLENEQFATDSTWRISTAEAYQSTGDPQGNYRLPESNLKFDARLANKNWIEPSFNDKSWTLAKSVGEKGVAPWNNLVKRPIPLFKTFPLQKADNLTIVGNTITIDLPYDMQYHPYLKVKAPAGKKININPNNLHTLNDVPLRGEYITKEGEQEYLHLPWLSGEKTVFILEDGIEVLELGYMESGYDTELDGTFSIDDDFIMRYFEKAQRTLYVNMRDTYFDCPDRERAQWMGDGVILSEESFYLLDNRAINLARKMYNELFDWQRDDNTMFGPIPAGNWEDELPQQILAAVGNYGFGTYIMYTGDIELMKKAYPHIKRYLSLWEVAEDGTVPFREGGWTWGDWGTQIDRNLLEHVWVYIGLDNLAYMANYLGKTDEATEIERKMTAIKNRVNSVFWTPDGYRSTTFKKETDDRGNALAVISGIAEKDKHPTIHNLFKKVEHASPYMEKYVMEALFEMGEGQFAMERFKKRFADMVNHPDCSTLWEFWTYEASVNHAWSGGPLSVLYKNMAGIIPTKPGFEEFTVFPELLGKSSLNCSFSTVKGDISLSMKIENDNTTLELEVPNESHAIVRIPLVADDVLFTPNTDIKELEKDELYRYYQMESGKWSIVY
ncbi:MAG TPA: alpha-L-rhamnosidase C-terminal domain-containing protein [Dysgonamonadaceae bacterium]|nr:alpha-L-rhamnosidase C-terminal domain-containing protein [Dysgonamonadaceae bacterium]